MIEPGTVLEGRYEVLRRIGEGAMAEVWEVRHVALHSRAAVKVLNADLAKDPDLRNRFLAEGRIQAQLRHPNIVAVTDVITRPAPGLVMEYVEGLTLSDHLEHTGPLDVKQVKSLFMPVLAAVHEAHRAGIVHRDLKPENILLGRDAANQLIPKVADFGVAKVLDEAALKTGKRKTRVASRMGTLVYMSPEQVKGKEEVGTASDIFSLGAILYELVTGRMAFDNETDFDTMSSIVSGEYEPPERVVGALDPVVGACIRKALAVSAEERFPSCQAFAQTLRTAGTSKPKPPPRPDRSYAVTGKPEPIGKPSRKMPPPERRPTPRVRTGDTSSFIDSEDDVVNKVLAVKASNMAVSSFVVSLVSFFFCCGFGHVASLLMANHAKTLFTQGEVYSGHNRGLADAAVALSWIGMFLAVAYTALLCMGS